ANVGAIIAAGTTVKSSQRCLALARENARVFAGVGVHPQDLEGVLSQRDIKALDTAAGDQRVVAVSEVGLDFLPGSPDRSIQEDALRAQIGLARGRGLPVIFHMRAATAETLRVLEETGAGRLGGAAHYFQGSWEEAKQVMDLGFKVSLAKPLLRLPELQEVARKIPMSEVVLETDAYPQYFKSKRERWTEPKDVALVAAKLAEIKGLSVEEVARATTANALEMLGARGAAVRAVLGWR
ncbi:MAG: TatD family hydrolase, partial [Chloroflexi bacterium]|nr:TatD family hydrolase [Chloroflexota bacterium]